jgi:uncharacterized protein
VKAAVGTLKEIRRFKVAINSACPLRCDYCLLDKEADEVLAPELLKTGLDMFLRSPGDRKKLLIYGGEPMLEFPLVRDVVDHAAKAAEDLGKSLCSTVATSGVVLRDADLEDMRRRDMHMSISIDGTPESHDRFRRYKDGRPSHARIVENLPRAIAALGNRSVTALMCVHPDNAPRMLEDFDYLISLGFENVNIEVVHGFHWPEASLEAFDRHLRSIGRRIRDAVAAGRFLFLESFAIPLQREPVAEKMCPFHSCLEVFPDGALSFYPFPFVEGLEKRPQVSIGSVGEGLVPRYRDCSFDEKSAKCRGCTAEYYTLPGLSEGNAPYELRTRLAEQWIREIALEAKNDERSRSYLKEAVLRSAMGYR